MVVEAEVHIIDFVDTGHPALLRMWQKRQRGYRPMGYSIRGDASAEATVDRCGRVALARATKVIDSAR
jgi:hypothetical protein